MNKEKWLKLAEVIDALRVVPRLLLGSYVIWVVWLADKLLSWYMALPAGERTLENGGFAGGVFTAATGLATVFINVYVKSGRRWEDHDRDI